MSNEMPDRRQPRTNMFVMATLYGSTGSTAAKIRDLSENGALIEADAIPPGQTPIRLARGSLSVNGMVVWRNGTRAGLKFNEPVIVSQWLPRGRGMTDQQRVDELVQHAKHQSVVLQVQDARPITSAELLNMANAIDSLANELAHDAAVIRRYGTRLQTLDIVGQALRKLAS